MFKHRLAGYFLRILAVAGRAVEYGLGGAYRGLHESLALRVFVYEAHYFLIMVSKLFDELLVMGFFSAHCLMRLKSA